MPCSEVIMDMGKVLPVHVTVVIPTRNEEEAIVDTIRSVPNDGWCEKLDFLIIDGNSSDKTRELAEGEGADVYLENLTVNSSVTLKTAGFRIFVKDTLINNGDINNSGTDGSGQNGEGIGGVGGTMSATDFVTTVL